MFLKRIVPLAAILGLLAACQDQPTAVDMGQPDARAAQGDMSEWVELFTAYYEGVTPMPCFNDGAGEDALMAGNYTWWAKTVVTPSGNVLQNLRAAWREGTTFTGMTTGDVWTVEYMRSPFFMHTRKDGETRSVQPMSIFLESEGGEIVKVGAVYHIIWAPDGTPTLWDVKVTACNLTGGGPF